MILSYFHLEYCLWSACQMSICIVVIVVIFLGWLTTRRNKRISYVHSSHFPGLCCKQVFTKKLQGIWKVNSKWSPLPLPPLRYLFYPCCLEDLMKAIWTVLVRQLLCLQVWSLSEILKKLVISAGTQNRSILDCCAMISDDDIYKKN